MSDDTRKHDQAALFIISFADILSAIYAMELASHAITSDDPRALLHAHNELREAVETLERAAEIASSH